MASLRTRGAMGDFTFTDAVRRERRVCREKRISGQIAALAEVEAAKIRGGHVDPREVVGQVQQARPIGEHLSDQNWWPRADGVIREVASRVEARLALERVMNRKPCLSRLCVSEGAQTGSLGRSTRWKPRKKTVEVHHTL